MPFSVSEKFGKGQTEVSLTCTSHSSRTHRANTCFENMNNNEAAEDMRCCLGKAKCTYPKIPHMRSEEARLKTFLTWPSTAPVRPTEMAQAGLFYIGKSDVVQCFCCAGTLERWDPGDTAWQGHEKYYSSCFFILGHDVGNIPLLGGSRRRSSRQCANNHVYMGSFEKRLGSFAGIQHPIDPERLARAGLYSTGTGDKVSCFCCGGGLKGWQFEEDPWEEHAKYYPGCRFLVAEKGQEFVHNVQLQNRAASSHPKVFSGVRSDVLQSAIAQKATEMGFEPGLVERIILEKIRTTDSGYSSVQALVEDCLKNSPANEAPRKAEQDEDPLEKLHKLESEKQCKICMDRDTCIVFIPCGHLVSCKECSQVLVKCPICCSTITQKIKTYIS